MRNVIIGVAVAALFSTLQPLPASRLEAPIAAVSVQVCTRVDGAQLGALPLEVVVGSKTVRFAEWTTADELSSEVFGFATQLPVGVSFTVQAGDQTFVSASPRWLDPRGLTGPRVHGIDAVTFCTQAVRPALALAE